MNIINWSTRLIQPKSKDLSEAFRERIIRLIVIITLVFFSFMISIEMLEASLKGLDKGLDNNALFWYSAVFAIGLATLFSLHRGNVRLAGRILTLSLVLILLDSTAEYWSAGTIILSLMFTLMFQLTLETTRETIIAISLNLLIYTYLAITKEKPDFLPLNDYFADPFTACITMYVTNIIMIAVSYQIRKDQAQRSRDELFFEQYRADILRQFLGNVSHDLNTPLTKIKTQLYLLERKAHEDSQRHVAEIRHDVNELDRMVSSMLEMVRLEEINQFTLQKVNMPIMVEDVISLYNNPEHATIHYDANALRANVIGDNVYLRRALSNLLENAIAVTPQNGQINVTINQTIGQIDIHIKDNGPGIPPQHLNRIFERFFRVDEARNQAQGRNGLGLAITKRIIELHGGSIKVHSVMGEGTEFIITLPTA